jgi:sporulation protein YlmC with PRC-barrel domain
MAVDLGPVENTDLNLRAVSDLVGCQVENYDGVRLGSLSEIVVDLDRAEVAYAVITRFSSGVEKSYPIPWSLLAVGRDRVVIDVDTVALEHTDWYDAVDSSLFENELWAREVHAWYGLHPYWNRSVI